MTPQEQLQAIIARKMRALAKLHAELENLRAAVAGLPKDDRQQEMPLKTRR